MAKNLLRAALGTQKRTPGKLNTRELIEKIESGYLPKESIAFKKKKSFAPSSLVYGAGECPRYWYLAFTGGDFADDNTPREIANMRNGSMSHERIQAALSNTDIMRSIEKKIFNTDPPIYGLQDAEVLWDGAPLPLEIKTANDLAFTKRKESMSAASYHIAQLLIYMRILGNDMGVILYENKNTHELFAVPVEMDDEYNAWLDKTFEWMRTVYKAWEDGKLPKKNYRSNSRVCKKCPLSEHCSTLPAEGDIELPSLEQLG